MEASSRQSEQIIIIDDDRMLLQLMRRELEVEGFDVRTTRTGEEGIAAVQQTSPHAVVLDLGLPDMPGSVVLRQLLEHDPELPVVILTGETEPEIVVELMRSGAVDFVPKPFDRMRLSASIRAATRQGRLRREVLELREQLGQGTGFSRLVGSSPLLEASIELLRRASKSEVNVLIQGDSGTGKEIAARALHEEGARRAGPFVAINCGAFPEGLVESELFGHEKGAFTGATGMRRGCFEAAAGGTLFLDEVGELTLDVQVRLLRAIQERTIQRVGSSEQIEVDVRIVAATNRDLRSEVEGGRFREDLFYRLAVFPVRLPSLRERGEDVLVLARYFLERFGDQLQSGGHFLGADAESFLMGHSWPGNVRELMNVVQRALILSDEPEIRAASLAGATPLDASGVMAPAGEMGLLQSDEILSWREYEERILRHALAHHGWNIQATTRALGLGRATMYRKIERYGLSRPGSGESGTSAVSGAHPAVGADAADAPEL